MDTEPRSPGTLKLYRMTKQRIDSYRQFIHLSPTETAIAEKPTGIFTNEDAAFAWCTKCKKQITFASGNNGLGLHTRTVHQAELKAFKEQKQLAREAEKKRHLTPADLSLNKPSAKCVSVKPSESIQLQHDKMMVLWVAKDTRPVSAVEGDGFRAYAKFVMDQGGANLAMPSRTRVTDLIKEMAGDLRNSLDEKVAAGRENYSITTDLLFHHDRFVDRP
jgi:hypothetical protein